MAKIVITYRRNDTKWITGRIFEYLEKHFGRGSVFVDIDGIPVGEDYRDRICQVLDQCEVLVAVIGPDWGKEMADPERLTSEEPDWVRFEIGTALKRNIPVVPLLIDRATLPQASELPEELQDLAYRKWAKVDTDEFQHHIQHFTELLEQLGVAPDRNVIQRLTSVASASTFAGKIEAFLEEYLISEDGSRPVPFAGRQQELDGLGQWLEGEIASRFVVTAPAGRGKSAMVVHWMERLESQKKIGRADGCWALVFVPISMRFNTNRPEVFYEAIAARLADVLGQSLKPAHLDPAAYYQDQCRGLLNQAIGLKKRILLIVDGVDEALGDPFDASWFPRAPGPYLRLLVTARLQVGDEDSRGWVARLGWTSGPHVRTRELAVLDVRAVEELLSTSIAPVDVLGARPEIVAKLHELADGEPLLLRLYIETLWQEGNNASRLNIEDLNRIQPGFSGYFEDWLDRQRRAWDVERQQGRPIDEGIVLTHLVVLACAYGPLTSEELSELVRQVAGITPGLRTENLLNPLRRFVIGTGRRSQDRDAGYVLGHPKFGEFLRQEYFDASQVKRVQLCFAAWGNGILKQLNCGELKSQDAPAYLLSNLAQHFIDVDMPLHDTMQFVEGGWMRAWERYEGGYRGFSLDVKRAAAVAARSASDTAISSELRCCLVLSSISSIGSMADGALVVACVKRGLLPLRTAIHWSEYRDHYTRAAIVVGLTPLLNEIDRTKLIARAVDAIRSPVEDTTSAAVSKLAPQLSPHERQRLLHWAVAEATSQADDTRRAEALAELVELLDAENRTKALNTALESAERVRDNEIRASCLGRIATSLSSDERKDTVLQRALDSWRAVKDGGKRAFGIATLAIHLRDKEQHAAIAEALSSIVSSEPDAMDEFRAAMAFSKMAPLLPASHVQNGLLAANALREPANKGFAFACLAGPLQGNEKATVLADALALIRKSRPSEAMRVYALAEVAKGLEGAARAEVIAEAVAATRRIFFPPYGISCLAEIEEIIPDVSLAEMLTISIAIDDEPFQSRVLARVASLLPEPDRSATFATAISIAKGVNGDRRVHAICSVADQLPEGGRAEILEYAVTVAHSLDEELQRASALVGIARLLPADQRTSILSDALVQARSIEDRVSRARAFVSLLPLLQGEQRFALVEETLAMGEAFSDPSAMVDTMLTIIEYLPEDAQMRLSNEVLAVAQSSKNEKALACAWATHSRFLTDDDREKAVADAVDFARLAKDDWERGHAFVAVAKALAEGERATILPMLATEVHSEFVRWYSFEELLKLLPDAQISVVEGFVESFRQPDKRARALAALIPRLPDFDQEVALRSFLRIAHEQQRLNFYSSLEDILPALARLEGSPGLLRVRRAILDAGEWFR